MMPERYRFFVAMRAGRYFRVFNYPLAGFYFKLERFVAILTLQRPRSPVHARICAHSVMS